VLQVGRAAQRTGSPLREAKFIPDLIQKPRSDVTTWEDNYSLNKAEIGRNLEFSGSDY